MPRQGDDLTPEHLAWLLDSRNSIQRSSARLYQLMNEHQKTLHQRTFLSTSEGLVAICFSLWRAAFLADKTALRVNVFDDAKSFLGKMITDNAIGFSQDRTFRDWTFNYYVSNAENRLRYLSTNVPGFEGVYERQPYESGPKPKSKFRWDACQAGLDTILDRLQEKFARQN